MGSTPTLGTLNQMKTRLAILDVDGTLFDGTLGIELLKQLIKRGIFSNQVGSQILYLYNQYKQDQVEKSVVVQKIYDLFAQGIAGQRLNIVATIAQDTWHEVAHNLFAFADQFISQLKSAGFRIILLSGSPIEMIGHLANQLQISSSDLITGIFEISQDFYTGKIVSYPGSSSDKVSAINRFIQTHRLSVDWANSLAIGDNERDLGILSLVGLPIAFEPNAILAQQAALQHMYIANRNSVIDCLRIALAKRV